MYVTCYNYISSLPLVKLLGKIPKKRLLGKLLFIFLDPVCAILSRIQKCSETQGMLVLEKGSNSIKKLDVLCA